MSAKRALRIAALAGAVLLIIAAIVLLERMRAAPAAGAGPGQAAPAPLKEGQYPLAPELTGITGYLNGAEEGLKLTDLRGKVVLIDFWTYTCINCIRTLPYLIAWDESYRDDGLVILGVHTPEFEFEKSAGNVLAAIEKYGITYRVVQDNEYATWRAFSNRYWPHKYLIDREGYIRYDHIGEGGYRETEQQIRELLEERNEALQQTAALEPGVVRPDVHEPFDYRQIGTPEIYFGYGFSRGQLGNAEGWQPEKAVAYRLPPLIARNKFYLQGVWKNNQDSMELLSGTGAIRLDYYARAVNIVAGASQPVEITVTADGKKLQDITVGKYDLYPLVSGTGYGMHSLEISVHGPGLMAYTFTFG